MGVATQNPELRGNSWAIRQHVVNFMYFMAQELREWMAKLGFRTVNEMIGRVDKLEPRKAISHWKAAVSTSRRCCICRWYPTCRALLPDSPRPRSGQALDNQAVGTGEPAFARKERVAATLPIYNTNRVVGTILGSEITRRYGAEGLPQDTIELHFQGSAGQSFGAFIPQGLTLELEGDANDYFGKGLSGGKLIVYPPAAAPLAPRRM